MRKIKFRGKDATTGKWVYGYYAHLRNKYNDCHCIITNRDVNLDSPRLVTADDVLFTTINPETVGQFTGLLDKNGKEIYEGDIVEYYELCTYCINPDCEPHLIGYGDSLCKKTSEVEFTDGSFELYYCGLHKECLDELKEREERDVYFETNGYEINDSIIGIKVIGNIHDNPGLINK